jgi:hypothetical protein
MKLPVFTDPVTKEPSFSLTVAAITFCVVLARWIVAGLSFKLGPVAHTFGPVTMDEVRGWLDPTLIFYAVRQGTKAAEGVAMARSPQSGVNP